MSQAQAPVTELLSNWNEGDPNALDQLTPAVYDELKRLAAHHMRRERPGHTLQSTAIVHEAWMRLSEQRQVHWRNRSHFFGAAAQVVRRILVDHARGHNAAKRGSGLAQVTLNDALEVPEMSSNQLLALDEALNLLGKFDAKQARVVELRFFTGLSIEETAEVMGISAATVKREWASARAWLFRELQGSGL
jgi:RNA polymerase sigma factor (TIGR02999 family)